VGAENYNCKFKVNIAPLPIPFLNKLKRREQKKRNPFYSTNNSRPESLSLRAEKA
jgi:hypothetical protein